jgi:hypothetical protein
MQKRNNSMLIGAVLLLFVLTNCNKTQESNLCLSYQKAPVTKVEGLATGTVNQDIPLTVSFACLNGCGQFGRFEPAVFNDTTTINVIARYEGCICTQDIPTRQTTYIFKATKAGTYYLKFWQTDLTYVADTIVVI